MNFVEVMIREQKMTQRYQTAFFAALPLFPFLLFGCIANRLLKAKAYLPQFILASPIVFLGLVARSWSEFLGFLQKRGT